MILGVEERRGAASPIRGVVLLDAWQDSPEEFHTALGEELIEEVTRIDDEIVLFMELETGLLAERLAKSQDVKVQDVLLALLRMYSADVRIGDDNRIGSGAFADAVDELSLRSLQARVERDWAAVFKRDADKIIMDCLEAHAYSRVNRGLPVNGDLDDSSEFVNARLSALVESCINICRKSDHYSAIFLEILKGRSPFVEAKLEWWQKWLTMKRKSDTPEKMQKYFVGLHAQKIGDLPDNGVKALFERRAELSENIGGMEAVLDRHEAAVEQAAAAVERGGDGSDLAEEERLAALDDARQLYMSTYIAYVSALDELTFIENRFQTLEDFGSHQDKLADATTDVSQ